MFINKSMLLFINAPIGDTMPLEIKDLPEEDKKVAKILFEKIGDRLPLGYELVFLGASNYQDIVDLECKECKLPLRPPLKPEYIKELMDSPTSLLVGISDGQKIISYSPMKQSKKNPKAMDLEGFIVPEDYKSMNFPEVLDEASCVMAKLHGYNLMTSQVSKSDLKTYTALGYKEKGGSRDTKEYGTIFKIKKELSMCSLLRCMKQLYHDEFTSSQTANLQKIKIT